MQSIDLQPLYVKELKRYPEDYFKENASMFIEENEIYFYEHGMNGSYKIY